MKSLIPAAFSALALPLLSSQAAAVVINFTTAADFTDNFRYGLNNENSTTSVNTASGYLQNTRGATSSGADMIIYDTTPASAAVQSVFTGTTTVTVSVRAAQAASSFGIFIINPTEVVGANQPLALFNWDYSGTTDQLRITAGRSEGATSIITTPYYEVNTENYAGLNSFVTLTTVYRQGSGTTAGKGLMDFYVGNTLVADGIDVGNYLTQYEVGFRIFDSLSSAGGIDVDYIEIVPEPSSAMLLGAAAGGFLLRCRRK